MPPEGAVLQNWLSTNAVDKYVENGLASGLSGKPARDFQCLAAFAGKPLALPEMHETFLRKGPVAS